MAMKKNFGNAFQNNFYIAAKQIERIKSQIDLEKVKHFLPLYLGSVDLAGMTVGDISGENSSKYVYTGTIEILKEGKRVGWYIKRIDLKEKKINEHLDLYGVIVDNSFPIK